MKKLSKDNMKQNIPQLQMIIGFSLNFLVKSTIIGQ